MASNQTTNYGLNQWEAEDKVLRTDFNADNAKIDAALNTLAGQVAAKAEQSALGELSQTHASDVAALRSENYWVKLSETVLTEASSAVTILVPQAEQLQKLLLEYNTDGPATITVYFLSQTNLDNGADTSSNSIVMGTRNADLAAGKVEILRAGAAGRVAAFGRYFSIDGISSFDGTPSYSSKTALLFQNLAAVRVAGEQLAAGSRFALYGLKK